MQKMQTLLVLGPPGAGKTTLIHTSVRSGIFGNRVAILCNDDGTTATTDAQVMADIADVQAMNSGCFGCRDEQDARRIISVIVESGRYDYLIVEPLGFVAGHEVPALLASCGIKPLVVTLVDVRHFEENLALSEIVPSQLRAATAAVALTKYANDITDPLDSRLDSVVSFVARFAPGLPIFLIPPGGMLPIGSLVNRRMLCVSGCGHHHNHHAHHHHEHVHAHHDHHDDHGFLTMSFRLKPDVTYNDVRQVCGQLPIMPLRLKGVVDGRQFHAVHGEWSQGTGHATENFLTFYHTSAIDISLFATISLPTEKTLEGDTKTLVRSAADVSSEATEHLIRTILARLPREAIVTAQGLVTNPEDHELLNEVRKRPGVSSDLNAEAIRARVAYYLDVADLLSPSSRFANMPQSATWKRDVAIGIGWFAHNKAIELGAALMSRVRQTKLDRLLSEGLSGLSSHNTNLGRALVFAQEVGEVLEFLGKIDNSLKDALKHSFAVAKKDGREEVVVAWQSLVLRWCE